MSPGAGPGHHILIVEDDADIRESVAELLSSAGYRVECARNGAMALEWLQKHASDTSTLVILDVRMPVMNGRAFLDRLASDPKLSGVTVLLFTASMFDSDGLLTRRPVRGALRKPSSTKEILEAVAACWSDHQHAWHARLNESPAPRA